MKNNEMKVEKYKLRKSRVAKNLCSIGFGVFVTMGVSYALGGSDVLANDANGVKVENKVEQPSDVQQKLEEKLEGKIAEKQTVPIVENKAENKETTQETVNKTTKPAVATEEKNNEEAAKPKVRTRRSTTEGKIDANGRLVIPEGTVEIESEKYEGNKQLKEVVLPTSVRKIGSRAFSDSTLEKITIPEGVEEIGEFAFSSVEQLKELTLPSTIKKLGSEEYYAIALVPKLIVSEGTTTFNLNGVLFIEKLYLPRTLITIEGQPERSYTYNGTSYTQKSADMYYVYENSPAHSYVVAHNLPYKLRGTTTKTETKTEVVNFEERRENDPTLEQGREVVAREGQNGVRTIVETITYVDGEETNREVTLNNITTAPVHKIIKVGTKSPDVVETKDETKTETIAFKVVKENDPTLEQGREVVAREGQNGERTIVETVTYTNGLETNRILKSNVVTTEPTDKIIKVGTKALDVVTTKTRLETVELTTDEVLYLEDSNLERGKTREEKAVAGKVINEVTEIYTNGQLTNTTRKELSRTEPTPKKVYRGTKDIVTTQEKTEVLELPYASSTTPDNTIDKGQRVVVQAGKKGSITTVYTVTYTNGVETSRVEKSRTKVPAVAEIIKIGTKVHTSKGDNPPVETKPELKIETKQVVDEKEIAFETVYKENPNLDKDTQKVTVEGQNGKVTKVYEVILVEGKEEQRKLVSENTEPATNKVVEVGTKKVETKVYTVERELPSTEVIYLEDSNLEVGKVREEKGTVGKVVVQITETYVNGKLETTEEKEISRTEPTATKVYKGTKEQQLQQKQQAAKQQLANTGEQTSNSLAIASLFLAAGAVLLNRKRNN